MGGRDASGRNGPLREPGRIDDLHGGVTLERVLQDRPAQQPSLTELHAEGLERFLLTLRLDAFGDHPRADVAAEGQQRHDERATGAVRVDRRDEGAVHLDELRPELGDDTHARVPGTGVVDRDAESACAQFRGDALQEGQVGDRFTFAELEHHRRGIHLCVGDGPVERGHAAVVDQGTDEHVDKEIGLADVRRGLQTGADAGEVDGRLHVERRGGAEEVVGGADPCALREPGQRLVPDDCVIDQADDRLESRDDLAAGEECRDGVAQASIGGGEGRSIEALGRRLCLRRPRARQHGCNHFENRAQRRSTSGTPDGQHGHHAIAAGHRNRHHIALVGRVREGLGEAGIVGEAAQCLGCIRSAVVGAAEPDRLTERLDAVQRDAHADHRGGLLLRHAGDQ